MNSKSFVAPVTNKLISYSNKFSGDLVVPQNCYLWVYIQRSATNEGNYLIKLNGSYLFDIKSNDYSWGYAYAYIKKGDTLSFIPTNLYEYGYRLYGISN